MKVPLEKIIPFSEARSKLSQLVGRVENELFFVISKQNKQKAVLVDLDYFDSLQKEAERKRLENIKDSLREKFLAYAKKKTKKSKITEKGAYRILTGENLTW